MTYPKNILICRNDAIGDTCLAIPMCGIIKKYYPNTKITFLGTAYTKPIVALTKYVDDFIDYNDIKDLSEDKLVQVIKEKGIDYAIVMKADREMAHIIKKSKIKHRIGMFNWLKHWSTCNRFVAFKRSSSTLNEAQLNLKFLSPFRIHEMLSTKELALYYGFDNIPVLDQAFQQLLSADKINIILHPKTTQNGREWPLDHFTQLIQRLDLNKFKIFITGGPGDVPFLQDFLKENLGKIEDLVGKLPINQFIAFIHSVDGLVAGSTGPVHIAAAMAIHALGLYTDVRSRNASRWSPVGIYGESLECVNDDMSTITVDMVLNKVSQWQKINNN